jgi:TolB-like protein/DNA-binding winged helix-turn-helix (wHTH) protein
LTREGQRVALRPKSFEVLCYLVAAAGEPVSRDDLARAIWRGVTVTDESLSRCVSDIRQALDDEKQDIIKTLPRRGYVFAARLNVDAAGDREAGEPLGIVGSPSILPRRRLMTLAAIGAAFVCALVLGMAAWLQGPELSSAQQRPSIAVLPFTNVGGDSEQDYFADGLTEDIAIRLSKFAELFVIASESAFSFKGVTTDTREIGRRLGVRYLVLGAVRREQGQLRVSARLVEAETGAQRWADIYDRKLADVIALQDELARRIVSVLLSRITQAELERAQRKGPRTLGAYDLFLRGRALLATVDTSPIGEYGQRLLRARHTLEEAVRLDPGYAPALTALSDTYNRAWLVSNDEPELAGEFQSSASSDKALALAEGAITADPTLPEAHSQLAWILHWRYRRGDALAEFRRAADLNPNMADGRYALVLAHAGRAEESIAVLGQIFRLDPLHRPIYFSYLANSYYLAGRYKEALETSRTTVDRLPAVFQARVWHAAAAAQLGLEDEARTAAAATVRLRPDFTIARFLHMIQLASPGDSERLREGLRKAGLPE